MSNERSGMKKGDQSMIPFKKILCPVDFSEPSYEGLKAAVELAGHFSSELAVLHVVSPMPVIPSSSTPASVHFPTVMQEMEVSAQTALDDLVAERVPNELEVRPMVVQGMPADEIVRMAEVGNADVIVIATHGMTGWRRFLFGSVAEKVVRTASIHVLTVPPPLEKEGDL
jgi:nucleotide-binding universal stress UspA family protein